MTAMARLSLFFICCYPSLSLAWCSGVGGGSVVKRQQLHTSKSLQYDRFAKNLHNPQLHNRRDGFQLCSINGGSQEDDTDTTTTASSTDKMTLQKATSLLKTFWSMAYPYYQESQPGRRLFYGMVLLTLMNSGVSVAFSYVRKVVRVGIVFYHVISVFNMKSPDMASYFII